MRAATLKDLFRKTKRRLSRRMEAAESPDSKPARSGLLPFIQATKPDYEPNWHHRKWCEKIDRFVSGDIKRLMLFAPPQNGKSEVISRRLPALILGQNPDARLITSSYSADLASRMNRDAQRIIDTPGYHRLFPDTTLAGGIGSKSGRKWLRTNDLFEIVDRQGYYRSAGVGGGITGMSFDIGLIDDPIKNQEEALSKTYRDKVWDWYTSTFYTRQAKDARILIVLTRWHVDDLAGRLLKLAKEDPTADQWEVLSYPAIKEGPPTEDDPREDGEPLWPERYPLDFLRKTRATLGSYQFSALYQQRPIPEEGGLFKTSWFRQYRQRQGAWIFEDGSTVPWGVTWRFTVIDPSVGKNALSDPTAIGTFCVVPGDPLRVLVLDMISERIRLEDLPKRLKGVTERWGSDFVIMEANGFQIQVARECRRSLSCGVKEVSPEGKSKLVRALPAIARAESGEIYLPAVEEPWMSPFLDELGNWSGQDGDRDDQVDVLAYAIRQVERFGVAAPEALQNDNKRDTRPVRREEPRRSLFGRGKERERR